MRPKCLLLSEHPAGLTRLDFLLLLVIGTIFQREPFRTALRRVVIFDIFASDIFENSTSVTRVCSHVFSSVHVLFVRTRPRDKRSEKGVRKSFDSLRVKT